MEWLNWILEGVHIVSLQLHVYVCAHVHASLVWMHLYLWQWGAVERSWRVMVSAGRGGNGDERVG